MPLRPPSNDLQAGATVQIRDRSINLPIPTVNEAGNEVAPAQLVKGLLDIEFIPSSSCPKPAILSKNEAIRYANLKRQPLVTVSMESYNESFNGHRHEHVDVEVPVLVEIDAVADNWDRAEQLCFNILAELRRIWYKWILALKPFHSLYWDGVTEDYEQGTNHCKLEAHLRLTAAAWPWYARRNGGEEIPAQDPAFFTPQGDEGDL